MISTEMKVNLDRLKKGEWDAGIQSYFEKLSAKTLIDELKADYGFVFLERRIGRKHEIGMAAGLLFELRHRNGSQSVFADAFLIRTLRHCFLVSSYDDALSEITWANRLLIKPSKRNSKSLRLLFGSGVKVDRTVDGWQTKPLRRGGTPLPQDVLKKRGWQFDLLQPYGLPGYAVTP
jgi:hypothetical protein